jgi:hypothetical protein
LTKLMSRKKTLAGYNTASIGEFLQVLLSCLRGSTIFTG